MPVVFSLCLLLAAQSVMALTLSQPLPKHFGYKVLAEYPHSEQAYTQGLEFSGPFLFESTGRYGRSTVQKRQLHSQQALALANLHPSLFGEGLTILGERLYQLTWRAGKALVFDAKSLQLLANFDYQGQGWGLCNNGQQLIMSDGSDQLRFINPDSFATVHSLSVTENGNPLYNLNELEWIQGYIFANIWQSNRIVIIAPDSGQVLSSIDLNGLLPDSLRTSNTDVLNGIAYDPIQQRLLVTGKNWPRLYHIELIPQNAEP